MVNTNISEENKNKILSINFDEKTNDSLSINELVKSESIKVLEETEKLEEKEELEETVLKDNYENFNTNNLSILDTDKNNNQYELLKGGVNQDVIIYNIDYLLVDDEKLINTEKVIKQVDDYINNYNSIKIQKYKQNLKQLYQKYSNKNYIIKTKTKTVLENKAKTNTTSIIVIKNDKQNKIVMELVKPTYYYYNENNNLLKIKRDISNNRAELLYKYETLISKLNIKPEDKKEFEKEKEIFIKKLEDYYTYTLYHKKINNINILNKSSLVLQKELSIIKEDDDNENKILSSNIYLIDNSFIDTMTKYNSENLIQYNNIMQTLIGKKEEDINKDKKIKEIIKTYIKNRNEIELFTQSLNKNADNQDNYIDYIVLQLP